MVNVDPNRDRKERFFTYYAYLIPHSGQRPECVPRRSYAHATHRPCRTRHQRRTGPCAIGSPPHVARKTAGNQKGNTIHVCRYAPLILEVNSNDALLGTGL